MKTKCSKGFGVILENQDKRIKMLESICAFLIGFFILIFIVLSFLIFATAAECYASEKMTKEEITLKEISWEVIHLLDTGTTLDIAKNPDKYYEFNPILGKHPSVENVYLYMGLSAILHPVITHYLPNKYVYIGNFRFNPKRCWLNTSLFISGSCVMNNFAIGLKINF